MLKKLLASLALAISMGAFAAVDVNKATEAELDSIKGVGPSTTQEIMNERKKGSFKDWDDLINRVKGIGSARAVRLSAEGLTVAGTSYTAGARKDTPNPKDAKAKAAAPTKP